MLLDKTHGKISGSNNSAEMVVKQTTDHHIFGNALCPEEHPANPTITMVKTRNIGEAEIYGMEFYVKQRVCSHLSVTAALPLNHSRITEDQVNLDNEGNPFEEYPGSLEKCGTALHPPPMDQRGNPIGFSDDRYYTGNNEELPYFHMKSYETLDIKVWRDWTINDKWQIQTALSCVNLTDKVYGTEIVYVNPGRYVEATCGVRYLF